MGRNFGDWGCSSVIKSLASMDEVLGSILSTAKTKQNKTMQNRMRASPI
jgi:hypothetical protein